MFSTTAWQDMILYTRDSPASNNIRNQRKPHVLHDANAAKGEDGSCTVIKGSQCYCMS